MDPDNTTDKTLVLYTFINYALNFSGIETPNTGDSIKFVPSGESCSYTDAIPIGARFNESTPQENGSGDQNGNDLRNNINSRDE